MKASQRAIAVIDEFEGLRLTEYVDLNGNRTIGRGHKLHPAESYPKGITVEIADSIRLSDVAGIEVAVNRLLKVNVSQSIFDALVSFTFNEGPERLATSTLLRDLNEGRPEAAREQLLSWVFAGDKREPGLVARRRAEYDLWGG